MTEARWIPVLAIDPSLTGFAYYLAAPGLPVYERRIVTSPTDGSVAERVARCRTIVDEVVEIARQHNPLCLIEGYAHDAGGHKKAAGKHERIELGGILRDRLLPHCSHVAEVAPLSLRKHVTGSGATRGPNKTTKDDVKRVLEERCGRAFKNYDHADAYGILQIGLQLVGAADPETDAQREVVAALRARAVAA